MPTAARRSASAVHDAGTYSSNVNGQVRPSAINALDTATWQLPILPSAPQYWRCTPTDAVPCLGKPVSSSARIPVRIGTSVRR
jgi:D-serine deaminase-like pyridoxal phosphate-dependent protein